MNVDYRYYPNRTLCNVLEDMRKAYETRNFSYLPGLIEECQVLGNKMEAAIGDLNDIKEIQAQRHELKKELKKLIEEADKLKEQLTE